MGDAAGIGRLWRRLDADGRRRFLDLGHVPSADPGSLAVPRPGEAAGVVAIAQGGESERLVGVARYVRTTGDEAEFLVVVDATYRPRASAPCSSARWRKTRTTSGYAD